MILKAENVTRAYAGKQDTRPVEVLKGVDLEIHEGSITSIVGSSGSGKSTLLHILGGLDAPTSGDVLFKGNSICKYSETERSRFRNNEIGFVFQFHHLLPEFTALENVMMPALIRNESVRKIREKASELLGTVGLSERLEHRPSMLSGGEQQRVAMARALINDPSLLLADEPTGNLDESNTTQLLDLILGLNRDRQLTIILVTHDSQIAKKCDRIIELKDGRIL